MEWSTPENRGFPLSTAEWSVSVTRMPAVFIEEI